MLKLLKLRRYKVKRQVVPPWWLVRICSEAEQRLSQGGIIELMHILRWKQIKIWVASCMLKLNLLFLWLSLSRKGKTDEGVCVSCFYDVEELIRLPSMSKKYQKGDFESYIADSDIQTLKFWKKLSLNVSIATHPRIAVDVHVPGKDGWCWSGAFKKLPVSWLGTAKGF